MERFLMDLLRGTRLVVCIQTEPLTTPSERDDFGRVCTLGTTGYCSVKVGGGPAVEQLKCFHCSHAGPSPPAAGSGAFLLLSRSL